MTVMDATDFARVAERHGIRLLVRFGSTVTGGTHASSDVDYGVLFDDAAPDVSRLGELVADLQALIPGREVDVAVLNRADPLFLKQVADTCELVHGSTADLAAFKLKAFHRYEDYRPFLAFERRYVERCTATRT
jgi:predicted nucleotidyltransferase